MVEASSPRQDLAAWLAAVTGPGLDPFLEEQEEVWEVEEGEVEEGERLDPTWGREGEECGGGGRSEGAVRLEWEDGDTFQGHLVGGRREGGGEVSSKRLGIVALTGTWKQGELEGKGRLVGAHINILH